jgi:hypothetical protein
MKFTDALEALMAGKYVARAAWDATGEYVVLLPGMLYIWKILTQPNPNAGNWLPLVADLNADDWKVVQKVEAVPAAA